MILAAGYGTRLRPITHDYPKPMAEVLGSPLLYFGLLNMKKAGIKNVVINLHHLSSSIVQSIGKEHDGLNISYSFEETLLGTGGGVKKAEKYLRSNGNPFLLFHGDTLFDFDLKKLFKSHNNDLDYATLVLKKVENMRGYGAVGIDENGQIKSFANWVDYKGPPLKERFFCGIHLLSPKIFDVIPMHEEYCITRQGYPNLIKNNKRIMASEHEGYFSDIGTPLRLWQANMDLLCGKPILKNIDPFHRFEKSLGPKDKNGMLINEKTIWIGKNTEIDKDATIKAPAIIDDGAIISKGAQVGPYSIVGKHSFVNKGAQVHFSVVFSDTHVGQNEVCNHRIICKEHRVDVNV
ncbi:NDP-sugar synthase [Sulfobacillus acidophilus]|uniref:NDP-sugar synthase n=1 Tax=Sulfobacillus acidophilus TaxID=53633 RepID=A0ABS3AVM8_9FIRM|nr:NDP-sugar synthase [Sulfobacillus acidophilus]